tara:strand:+ start:278 stop:382 length:105 start_codon:yes stop_codon:yes gene_type:complete
VIDPFAEGPLVERLEGELDFVEEDGRRFQGEVLI